ncbi:MAG: DNA polymerase III subunit gamma/tau [Acidimicrobiales bacterium]
MHGLPVALPPISPAEVLRDPRSAAHRHGVEERGGEGRGGPRLPVPRPAGTGKTTSARVLAKALNCTNLGDDSEPCGECESCVAIEEGRSFDLHELDAASNNGVEDMRDLLAKVNLGTPGNVKVYILDEVHMLTRGAENALLKTLEEPPDHVIWVLATTEPHKVVQTIRSRCQVFELGLLGAEEMAAHVRWIIDDAGLDVDEAAVDHVVSVGGGSARDTLSALDRVVAAGGVVEIDQSTDRLLFALADRDATVALASVGDALGRGRDPRTIGEGVLAGLRDAFLTAMGSPPPRLTPTEALRAEEISGRMTPAAMTRSLEVLGTALVDMRQAPDPRVDLEVALVRLCRADADRSVDSLVERIDQLEARLNGGAVATAVASVGPPVVPAEPAAPPAPAEPVRAAPPVDTSTALAPPPSLASAGAPEPAVSRPDGPAAAARAALAQKLGRPAPPIEPVTLDPDPVPPPPPVGGVPDAPAASSESAPANGGPESGSGLAALRPESPREVVGLAAEHLGIDKDVVVARANELLGPADGSRSVEQLSYLWQELVAEFGTSATAPLIAAVPDLPPDPDPRPRVADSGPPDSEPDPGIDPDPGLEEIDLDDLVDAPAHTEQFIEKVTEAFPGAELHIPEEHVE